MTPRRPSASRSPRCPRAATGPALQPNGTPGVFTTRTLNRWKVRLEHVADDLPYGFRGVLTIRDYSDEQYLQDLERYFALASARQIVSRGVPDPNFGDNSFNLRFERSESFFGTTVLQERFPSLEFSRRTSQIGSTAALPRRSSPRSPTSTSTAAPTCRAGTTRASTFTRRSRFPWKTDPVALGHGEGSGGA